MTDMRILKGWREDQGYAFEDGSTSHAPFKVVIDWELSVDADPHWWWGRNPEHPMSAPNPERPNLRTVHVSKLHSLEDAESRLAAWTPALIKRLVTKPPLWWGLSYVSSDRGFMTRSGRAKWRRNYRKHGDLIASLRNTDSDWRHGITRDWIYLLNLWNVHGSHHLAGMWWDPKEAPRGALEHYNEIERVRAILRSQDCPAPIRELYAMMSCDENDFDTERS